MRVMFLSDLWRPFPGGAENYVFNIAKQLDKRDHEISILTSYERAEAGYQDFELVQELGLGRRENREQRALMLLDHTSALKPDVIFIHRYFAEEYGEVVQQWGHPVVEVVHRDKKLQNAQLYVYNTEYTRTQNGAQGDPRSMVIVPPPAEEAFNFKLGVPNEIGFVKPLPGKGVDFVYDLAHAMPDRKFLILRGEWQPLETICELPNVSFLDPVKHMSSFYERCRIMLMPSLSEDAGTIPQESAVNMIPCISSDIMGLPETNAAGIRLPLDVGAWKEVIQRLDNRDAYNLVANREQAYLATFKWNEKFDQLDAAIRGLLR